MIVKIVVFTIVLQIIACYFCARYFLNTRFLEKQSTKKKLNNDITRTNHDLRSQLSENTATNCTMWHFPDQIKTYKYPKIILDPKRFLYPGLANGPNNQINGLINAIYLSIVLNR